jgi:hypothetical protein
MKNYYATIYTYHSIWRPRWAGHVADIRDARNVCVLAQARVLHGLTFGRTLVPETAPFGPDT